MSDPDSDGRVVAETDDSVIVEYEKDSSSGSTADFSLGWVKDILWLLYLPFYLSFIFVLGDIDGRYGAVAGMVGGYMIVVVYLEAILLGLLFGGGIAFGAGGIYTDIFGTTVAQGIRGGSIVVGAILGYL